MLIANPRAQRGPYPVHLHAIMNLERVAHNRRWLSTWPRITAQATPLWDLPDTAQRLGIARFSVKDESLRSPLASFKILGAPIALMRQILRAHPHWQAQDVLIGRYAAQLADVTVISATDGNHGRSLAAAAHDAGCRCVIVLHAQVSREREQSIAEFGAQIVRIDGNYDASVQHAADLAHAHGWQVISDTSWAGYEDVPRDVMQGYGTIAQEILSDTPTHGEQAYTHVFLQGGVGGLAAGIIAAWWETQGAQRPCFIVVEPEQADCLLQSCLSGYAAHASGSVDSIMAGLACGAASPLAWQFLESSVDHFMTITDEQATAAVRALAQGSSNDVPIVAGESGVAALAALEILRGDAAWSAQTGLDESSRVLMINTEGATAAQGYQQCVGESAESVRQRQRQWLAKADCPIEAVPERQNHHRPTSGGQFRFSKAPTTERMGP